MTPDIECVWQHPPAIVRKAPKVATVPLKPRKRRKPAPVFIGCETPEPPVVLIPPPEIVVEEEGGFSPAPEEPDEPLAIPPAVVPEPPESFDAGCNCGGGYAVPVYVGGGFYSSPPINAVYRSAPIPEPEVYALLLLGLAAGRLRGLAQVNKEKQ